MSIKISELPEATAIGNDDLLAIVQEGSTKKITFGNAIGKAQQITEISRNTSTYYHLDEDFTVQGSLPLEEGIYYNNTKQTLGTIRIVTGFSDNTFTYTTLPYGSYLIVFPVQVYTPSLDITHRYYKLLVITRGTASVTGPYADDLVHIKSYMVTASVGDFFNTMTCVESEFENDAEAVYEALAEKQAEIDELYDQIPSATATGETINVQDSSNLPIKDFAMLGNATQDGTPTPDTPQDIHVVTGDNTLNIGHKNLFEIGQTSDYSRMNNDIGINGNTFSIVIKSSGDTWTFNTKHNYTGDKTYTLTAIASKTYSRFFIRLRNFEDTGWVTNSDYTITGWNYNSYYGGWYKDNVSTTANVTITIPNCLYWQIGLGYSNNSVTTGNTETISNVQIELGSTATTYEPFIEPTTQLLSLGSIELAKIGDYTDRIYKSGDKWYWYKLTKKVNLAELTWDTYKTDGYRSNTLSDILIPSSISVVGDIIATKYIAREQNGTIPNGYIAISGTSQLLCVDTTGTPTGTAYYVLATPTTTEITDETLLAQLENILAMHTNKNVTNAWIEPTGTNAQAGMVLVYRQDLETMFDNISNG